MANIKVDGKLVEVPDYYTLMQAAEAAGAEIPRFCYHERLSVAGNCRMCLIEVKGGPPKPQASCAMGVRDLRPGPNGEAPEIFTNTPMVKKAREGVMEFLLINHPLDCPICDQGGECDLQDQAMAYGVDSSRFHENKRAVEDKYLGPLVKTSMNRCILCTRCVRFTTEVAGVTDMGLTGRGEDAEITSYLERALSSELSGNVVDLCPVGALTSKPYAFHARPWELAKTETIDVMDALGSAIRVDSRGREVMRILPRVNEDINEEWISDKTRHVVDGLRSQRLDRPYVRKGGRLQPAEWPEAFAAIARAVKGKEGSRIGAIAGDLAAVEEMYALKALMTALGSGNTDCRPPMSGIDPTMPRSAYIFNPTIAGIDEADLILIVGANPRKEAAVLNARIRKAWLKRGVPVAVIGEQADLTYPYDYLGAGIETLAAVAAGTVYAEQLAKAKKPLVIVGEGAATHPALGKQPGRDAIALAAQIAANGGANAEGWNGFAMLHNAAGRVGGLDIGFTPHADGVCSADQIAAAGRGEIDVVFLLGADEFDTKAMGKAFVVYIGTHGDRGAHRADVILPAATYTEKSATYVNTEGRVQMTERAVFPPGDAREDWAIIRALSAALGKTLSFNSLNELRAAIYAEFPHLARIDQILPGNAAALGKLAKAIVKTRQASFASPVTEFYLTNPIARASAVMGECAQLAAGLRQAAE